MKPLRDLHKDASEINLTIRRLLLSPTAFQDSLTEKIAVVTEISTLRTQLARIQREIRERTPDNEEL